MSIEFLPNRYNSRIPLSCRCQTVNDSKVACSESIKAQFHVLCMYPLGVTSGLMWVERGVKRCRQSIKKDEISNSLRRGVVDAVIFAFWRGNRAF